MNKKVLLIRNAYSFDFGGAERFPVALAKELNNYRYNPIIVSRSASLLELANNNNIISIKGPWLHNQDWSGKKILLFPVYLLWQTYLILWYLYVASSKKIDILHPQSRDDFIGATIAGKILRKKVIWTDHADLKYVFQNHKVWYKNPVGKLVHLSSRLADKITLVSHNEKILIEKSLGKKTTNKYVVIHNGVSDTAYEPTKRSHDDKDAIIFSATSRLVTAKGIGELIDAFLAIETKHNIRLWILGVGPEEKKFKTKAKASNNISFLGYPENALNYVASSDIFVHPSYHEGFSISLVEAAMLGKPIIACAVGGNPEIIENNRNGVLIKEKSADELCEAMEFLIKNPNKRKTYSINIRKTYDENFNFHNIVQDKFVRLYEQ